jgi:hypothetical protein
MKEGLEDVRGAANPLVYTSPLARKPEYGEDSALVTAR